MNDVEAPNDEMETTQSYTINDFCRLCANLDDIMVPIYADEGADHMLESKIKAHLPFINICKNDLLPKRICYHCASAVLVWNELYECSTEADNKLRSMFEGSSFDQRNCKNVPFDDTEQMNVSDKEEFIGEPIEYDNISNVNMFNKNEKSKKTLNELDKVPSTSKTNNESKDRLKSSVIQDDNKINPVLKSEMTDIYERREVDDEDSEDNSIYLNAAGIDDDMNGLMNHRLDMSAEDECVRSVVPKQEYISDLIEDDGEIDEDDGEVDEDDGEVDEDDGEVDEDEEQKINLNNNNGKKQQENHHQQNDTVSNAMTDGNNAVPVGITAYTTTSVKNKNLKSLRRGIVKIENGEEDNNDDDNDDDDDDEDDGDDDDDDDEGCQVRQLYMNTSMGEAVDNNQEQETMCQICATVFKTRYNLLRHFQKRHPEFKMYECDLCRISFPSIDEFKDHLEEKHSKVQSTTQVVDTKQVRFACDVCGNMYKNKASAMNHLLTHTAKKTVMCTTCDFSCYTKQQLSVHQTKHDKRFVCDICNKRFAQKSQLDVHINAVHYNQRPFVCVLCKKSFKTKGSHDAHMIVHTDTRNYQCPHCDKKCRKRYDLTLHIRTHTGEKPFKCSVCGRGFVQMCDTRKHEMLHFKPGKRKNIFFSSETMTTIDDD